MPRAWTFWLILALGLGLGALGLLPPPPRPLDAPAKTFSAERALTDVRLLAHAPHPIGSAEEDRVRQVLIQRMTALGLGPSVREDVGVHAVHGDPARLAAGTVRNVLGVLPGRDRAAPAVLLMAHYDSTPNSPGAADDIAGVAALLEAARALQADGLHPRDVLFLATEGEEAGLLGAQAFFAGDPLAAHVGVVVNMDVRGDAGRASMFETGPDDGALIALYGRAERRPFANSLTALIYRLLPNDTDFTQARLRGLRGFNFAFIDDQLAYHTPLATPDHLSRASLQHLGGQALNVALALANAAALPGPEPDQVYFDVLGAGFVHYPPVWGWVVVAAALAALVFAWRSAGAQAHGSLVAQGALAALASCVLATLCLYQAGMWLGGDDYANGYHLYRQFDLLLAGASLVGFGCTALVYAIAAGGGGRLWRPLTPQAAAIGALAWVLAAAALCQAMAPMAAPLFAWPALLGALSAVLLPRRSQPLAALAITAAGALSTAMLLDLAQAAFVAIGPAQPIVLAAFAPLLLAGLAPFLSAWSLSRPAPGVAGMALLAGSVALLIVGLGAGSPRRPALAEAFYYADPADHTQLYLSPERDPGAWTRAVLAMDGGSAQRKPLAPLTQGPLWQAPARARNITPPELSVSRMGDAVRIVARPTGGGRALMLFVRTADGLAGAVLGGRAVALSAAPGAWAEVDYAAPPPAGVELSVSLAGAGPVEVLALEQRDGWPAGVRPPPKSPDIMAWRNSDTTLVAARALTP